MPKTTPDKSLTGTCSPPKCIPNKRKTVLRITLAAFAVLLVFSLAAAPASAVQTYKFNSSTGSGSVDSPFVITEDKDLALIATAVNSGGTLYSANSDKPVPADGAFYKLGRDIDLSGVCGPNVGGSDKSWTPIGTYDSSRPFKGTFDGAGHTISDLYINAPLVEFQGLFGYTHSTANIKNLRLVNVNVTGFKNVGGLVGQNYNGKIENCSAAGNVTGNQSVGGLVGWNNDGTIKNCYATGNVTGKGEGDYVGGLAGGNQATNSGTATITNCYATGNVTGKKLVGGLVGQNDANSGTATITNCYATGKVTGTGTDDDYVGGLVGQNNKDKAKITNCYATGAVTGSGNNVGGLVGWNTGTIENSYATGDVEGEGEGDNVGGLTGQSDKIITNCYATGNVTSNNENAGGLVGNNTGTGAIENCYVTGDVRGTNFVGGLAGQNTGRIKNSTALNQLVNSTLSSAGRIVGSGSSGISNCYAWEGMLVKDKFITDETSGNINGESVSVSQIWAFSDNTTPAFWTYLGFGTNWTINISNNKYKLPILNNIATEDASYLIFKEGDGGTDNPYLIKYAYDLKTLSYLTNSNYKDKVNPGDAKYSTLNYKLDADIDLSTVCSATNGSWTPIGTDSNKFQGTFDGGNHIISKLYINTPSVDYQGLFGCTNGATIKNLGVKDVNVTGLDYVGGLVGRNNVGTITNSSAAGAVTGNQSVGGLVGYNNGANAKITNSSAAGAVTGSGNNVGGLVGRNNGVDAKITNCYTTGAVNGNMSVGGMAGYNIGTIENSVALNPSVNATGDNVGRVVGSGGTITNCYAWEGMLVNDKFITDGTSGNENGERVSVSQIWAFGNSETIPAFWTDLGFTDTNWDINNSNNKYKLPLLKNIAAADTLDASYLIFREGTGETDTPYLIKYAYELKTLSYLTNNSFVDKVNHDSANNKYSALNYTLSTDIDLSTVCSATNGSWTPIGNSSSNPFTGTFDGGNHIISNLYINTPSVDYQGLFGYTDSATIKNLGLINVNATGDNTVGGLVGRSSGTITNCYATGNVTGTQNVGGLVGQSSVTITNCYATIDVTCTGANTIGGLVGWNTGTGTITNCYAAGTVTGNDKVGGLAGQNDGSIKNSTALNQFVNGSSSVGRVVGSGSCDNTCYAWEGMTDGESSSSSLFTSDENNGTAATSAQVWDNTSFYSTLWGDISTIWQFNRTNQKYILPVLQTHPDTSGLDASYLDPSAPININLCTITITNVTYNGSEQAPIVQVARNGVIFTDANYTVTGNNKTAAGDYKLTITGKEKIAGSVTKDWNISKAALSPANFTYTAPTNLVYNGTEKTVEVKAKGIYGIGNISITYHNATTNTAQLPIAVGTYNVSISVGEGINYTAASDLHASGWNFTIQPLNINSNVTVSLSETSYTYDGNPKEPTVNVTKGLTLLREYIDYNVTGDKTETSVGEYNITVTGINNYTGLIDITWNITKAPLYPENFTYKPPSNLVYDGTAKTAQVEAKDDIYGIGNISITYHNATTNAEQSPIAAGTYKVNISVTDGTNYTAASDLHGDKWNFTIQPIDFDGNVTVSLSETSYTYDGTAKTPTLSVNKSTLTPTSLTKDTDYKVTGNITETAVGEYNITVTGTGNYTGTIKKSWNITSVKEDIPTASNLSFVYNGTAITLPASYESGNITASNLTFTSAGNYTAEFELKDKTNYTWSGGETENKTINWNITRASLSADNFIYTAPTNLVYDGTEKTAQVVEANRIYGIGNISITYHNATTNAKQSPIAAGTYNVNISVGDGTNYTAANDLHASGWNFTIEKRVFSSANITFTIEPDTYVFDGTAKTPALNVTDNYTNLRITEFTASGNTTETAVGTYNVTVTGTGNYTADSIEKTWGIIEPAPTPAPTSPSSGGSTDTGSGHFTDYPRTVSDGGHVSFGTSPIVTGVDMPEGVTGNVELITVVVTDTDGREFYATFEINAPESADGGKSLIYFELDLKKIEADGYTVKDVVLSHKNEDGTWTDLKTTYLGTENGKAKYSAENTVGYSVFAIYYTEGASIENTDPAVTPVKTQTAEPVSTYVEPTKTVVPTTEQTKSPVGLVGLGLGLLGAATALRRK